MRMKTPFSVWHLVWAVGLAGGLSAADVSFYGIAKLQQFTQTNASSVSVLGSNGSAFASFVLANSEFTVTNATVKPSSSALTRTLNLDTNRGVLLGYTNLFNSNTELEQAFPTSSGLFSPVTYTVTMRTTGDGTQSGNLSFYLLAPLLAISYPPTPQITNFAAAQAIDTTRDFTLLWSNLGGSALTIVQLLVTDPVGDAVFTSALPFQSGALTGASNGIVLPAHGLPPGMSLTAHLLAANPGLPNTNSYPGATGLPVLAKDLQFPITTRPAPTPVRLALWPAEPGRFGFQFASEPARLYQIQTSSNLRAWETLFRTNSTGTSVVFTEPSPPATPGLFYRVQTGD